MDIAEQAEMHRLGSGERARVRQTAEQKKKEHVLRIGNPGIPYFFAEAINASIASASLGTAAVMTSGSPRVTTTSSSMRMPMPRHFARHALGIRRDVDARFDRDDHAGFEFAELAIDAVVADVVHVEAEPMPGLVHVETAIGRVRGYFSRRCP